jgi:tetratricopeptide (TPR) repeat protein
MAVTNPAMLAQTVEEAARLYRQGRFAEAEKICSRVLRAQPNWFDALHLLGVLKLQGGKAGAACTHLEQALKLNPTSSQVMSNLGMALAALNRDQEALTILDRAVAIMPASVEAITNRGNVLMKLGRSADALAAFDAALALAPGFPGALANRGNALAALGRCEEALAQYDAVLAVVPAHAETHLNRGSALMALSCAAEAVAAFDRALALRPDYVKAHLGRGAARQALNQQREALEDFERAIALDKSNADAHHNAALARLTLGDYRRGFEQYEWRWKRSGMPARRRSFGKPLWLGEYPLARKRILIAAEQGLGDCIQFARYVPLLARSGATVVLEAPPPLCSLFARLEGAATVVARGDALPDVDVYCPAGSLPRALRTEVSSIPADVPYLRASEAHLAKWRERIERLPQPRIAVAWAGSADHVNDRNRSLQLRQMAPLFGLTAGFISIQRELRATDAEELTRQPALTHVGEALADFDDTAAVVTLADLVITVDTSVAHLAGALGRPTCVLVPFWPDWRWLLERADSPWYPTMRLCRQPKAGDWESVIAQIAGMVRTGDDPASYAGLSTSLPSPQGPRL